MFKFFKKKEKEVVLDENGKPLNSLEIKRRKIIEQVKNGTYKVDTGELSRMSVPLSWERDNPELIKRLRKIAEESGLIKKDK